MKNPFYILLLLFLPHFLIAQQAADSGFTDLFEETNIGNLHLFANANHADPYTFSGTPISSEYRDFLPLKMRRQILKGKLNVEAIYSIRGNKLNDFYILNLHPKNRPSKLVMYRMDNERLKKIKTLAAFQCEPGSCVQIDSWISDFNGDTRLDLLQKTKSISNGKEKVDAQLFLLDENGHYKKNDQIDLRERSYIMK